MPQTATLVSVEVVTDSDTGIYEMGEFDFSVPATAHDHLKDDKARKGFAEFLRFLADAAEKHKPPFRDWSR